MEDTKIVDRYGLMEEYLKDDSRSIKFIKNLGKELINKIGMINEEIDIINPNKKQWNTLVESDCKKLIALYSLKAQYYAQFEIIKVILNKSDKLMGDSQVKRYKEKGLEDRFFINIVNE